MLLSKMNLLFTLYKKSKVAFLQNHCNRWIKQKCVSNFFHILIYVWNIKGKIQLQSLLKNCIPHGHFIVQVYFFVCCWRMICCSFYSLWWYSSFLLWDISNGKHCDSRLQNFVYNRNFSDLQVKWLINWIKRIKMRFM